VIGDEHRGRKFAIIIDEAHSSQSGKTAALNERHTRATAADGERAR
jgi:type I restriction enzyme R subunit